MSSNAHANVYTSSSLINMLPSEPSICVPRIYMNIEKERVYDVFTDLFGLNAIDRVDMIERTNKGGETYKLAFVHFKFWPRTEQANEVRLKLLNGEEVKVVYDQPWYWRISASRLPRPEVQLRERELASRPYIMIDETEKKSLRTDHVNHHQHAHQSNSHAKHSYPNHNRHDTTHYTQRPMVNNERGYQHYPRTNHHSSHHPRQNASNHHVSQQQQHQHHHQQRQPRRYNEHRPSNIHITPVKEPEIESWVNNKALGAPMKGKKPRLLLSDDNGAGAGAGAGNGSKVADDIRLVLGRGRKLSFDETSGDITYAKSPMTPPTLPNDETAEQDATDKAETSSDDDE